MWEAILADYMSTELVCRSGSWQKKYIVVYNAAHAEIYEKYREQLMTAGAPAQDFETTTGVGKRIPGATEWATSYVSPLTIFIR